LRLIFLPVKKKGNKNQKIRVAREAANLIEDEMIVGVGTGSTVKFFIEELGKKVSKGYDIHAVCTSYQTKERVAGKGINIVGLSDIDCVDIAVDGADQVDKSLNAIKGGGGAHFREKVVATYSDNFVIIVDQSKVSNSLDTPVPIEVVPFAYEPIKKRIMNLGGNPKLRQAVKKDGPVISENGNMILDCDFGIIKNPVNLSEKLDSLPGIIEHGIFCNTTDCVYVGKDSSIEVLDK